MRLEFILQTIHHCHPGIPGVRVTVAGGEGTVNVLLMWDRFCNFLLQVEGEDRRLSSWCCVDWVCQS
jgi:hypothetical protein